MSDGDPHVVPGISPHPNTSFYAKLQPALSILILLICGLGMLSLSWLKWPDALVDFGHELYIPWQLSAGGVLYKDIAHLSGPLSPYFNALLFRLFGAGLMTLVGFNLLLIAALAGILYRLFLRTADRLTATAVCAAFLTVFAFSQYIKTGNYNFVCPYSHHLTHGVFLAFLAIYLFMVYVERRQERLIGIIGLLIGMTFLTKAEVFFAIFTAMSSGMLLLAWTDRISVRRIFRTAALFLAGLFVPILIGVAALSCAMPVTRALAAVTLQYQAVFTPIASNVFYRTVLGIDAPAKNIAAMLSMVRWYAIVPSVLFLLCVVTNRLLRREWRMSFACAVTAVFFLAIPSFVRHLALFEIFRPLPLAMLVAAGYYFVCLRRGRTDERIVRRSLTMLVVTLFAFLLLLKMILSVRVYHYGFALALPAVLTLGMMLIYEFPLLLGKRFKEVAFVRGLSVGFCALILLMHVAASAKIYGFKNFAVGAGPDTLLTYDQRVSGAGPCLREAVGQIEKIVGKQDTLVVFPEGVMLNYLTRRRNPSPYITFVPAELTMFGEDKMAEACDKARPDCVVLVSRDMSEYGYAGFGNDYAMKLFAWLKTNYGQVAAIGDASLSGKGFGIIIAKRLVPSSGAVRTATNN